MPVSGFQLWTIHSNEFPKLEHTTACFGIWITKIYHITAIHKKAWNPFLYWSLELESVLTAAKPCLYSCIFQKFSFIIFKLVECWAIVHLCVCISTCVFLCFYRCVYVCVEGGLRAWRTWPSNAGLSQSVYFHYSWMSGRGKFSPKLSFLHPKNLYYFTLVHPEGVFVLWLWWGWWQ